MFGEKKLKYNEGDKYELSLLLFSALALCKVHNMVQIPGFLILLCKKKPPAKAVVIS
tara:strand:- start:285 stop:455 length:171 start_codon:yes stop_codon:yes gene_type:complete